MDGCSPPPPPSQERCYQNGPCTHWVVGPWSTVSTHKFRCNFNLWAFTAIAMIYTGLHVCMHKIYENGSISANSNFIYKYKCI